MLQTEAMGTHVMCSYNSVNGLPACGNGRLLNDVLRKQWGFEGFVVSGKSQRHSAHLAEAIDGSAQPAPTYSATTTVQTSTLSFRFTKKTSMTT